jgi:hypothetical protein
MNNAFTGYVSKRIMSVISGIPGGPPVRVDFTSGYVVSLTDSFAAKYETTDNYSNPDQMKHYTNTPRSMNITIQLIAENINFARSNMQNISKLAQLCYPTYRSPNDYVSIDGTPKVQVKIMNLVCDAPTKGYLPGYLTNLNYDFDLQEGVYELSKEEIYPKYIKISFNFEPEHAHILGYDNTSAQTGEGDSTNGFQAFPYGVDGLKSLKADSAAKPENQTAAAAAASQDLTPEQLAKKEQNDQIKQQENPLPGNETVFTKIGKGFSAFADEVFN